LFSYRDKGKVRQKRATGTFLRDDFNVIATRRSGRVRFSSETCRFPHLFLRFLGKGCFARCDERLRGFAPKTPTKGDTVPFGNPWLRYNNLPLNYNLMFKITNFFTREKKICEKIKKLRKTLDSNP
ncbi:MAG: hypothetical protein IKK53_07140, partial [Ruminiclostridium sp.]|nr:hypothetical protein [Ruminiclostridium sp.]